MSEPKKKAAPKSRYERNLDAEINPTEYSGPTEADTDDGTVQGKTNPVVAANSDGQEPKKLPEPAKSVAAEDAKETVVEAEPDATNKTLDEKIAVTNEALETKRDTGPVKYGEPDGVIVREGEKVNIPTEKNQFGQDVATADVWQERTYANSNRPSYFQIAVKGVVVSPYTVV